MSRLDEAREMKSMENKSKSEYAHVSHYSAGTMDRETAALARSGKKQVLKVCVYLKRSVLCLIDTYAQQ